LILLAGNTDALALWTGADNGRVGTEAWAWKWRKLRPCRI